MNGSGENPLGTRARKASLLDAKTHLRIGTWNVQTMFVPFRTTQVLREMQSYKLHILGVSECRCTGFGQLTMGTGETILYSGRDDDQHLAGVALILKKGLKKALIEWQPVNERLIRARLNGKHTRLYKETLKGRGMWEDEEEDEHKKNKRKNVVINVISLMKDLKVSISLMLSILSLCLGLMALMVLIARTAVATVIVTMRARVKEPKKMKTINNKMPKEETSRAKKDADYGEDE